MRPITVILRASDGSRLRLPTTVVPIDAEDGSMVLLRDGSPLRVQASHPGFRELVRRLHQSQSPSELIDDLVGRHVLEPRVVLTWLEQLQARGLLFEERTPPADSSVDWERYVRQLDFFAVGETVDVSRFDRQRRLQDSLVVQVGVGGLGTWIAQNLALAGIGNLTLVDGDRVERTNLSRQVLYTAADVGSPKVVAASRVIRRLNPGMRVSARPQFVRDVASFEGMLDGAALVIVSADEPFLRLRRWITKACFNRRVPHLFVSASTVGPLVDPDAKLPCWLCQEAALRQQIPDFAHWLEQIEHRHVVRSPQAVFPGYHSVLAGLVTMEAIRQLTGFEPPHSRGQLVRWEVAAATLTREPLVLRDDCEMRH